MPPPLTVIAMVALPTAPAESLTEATMRCVPADSVLVLKERPVPMTPSRLETRKRPKYRVVILPQACARSPGQRNTTTSPGFGVPSNTRPVSGRLICIGSEAVP